MRKLKLFALGTFTAVLFYALTAYAAVSVTVNGSSHTIPQTNEKGWGANVTAWIQAISQHTLQKSGGTFTLSADADFGGSFGLKSAYFSGRSTPSTAGLLRLGVSETVGWRNNANSANLLLAVNASDKLIFNGALVPTLAASDFTDSGFNIVDDADATKKIAFQASGITTGMTRTITVPDANVNLGALTNSNIAAAAAIVYSKLSLADSILNADINSGAAIAYSKLAALTADRALVSNGTGAVSVATTTATEIGYVNGVTSAIQTQLDAKQARSTLTTKGDIYVATANATVARQAIGTDGQVLTADAAQTNGLKWSTPVTAPSSSLEFANGAISATISLNTLVIALKDASGSDPSAGSSVKVGFRNETATTGTYSQVSFTVANSITLGTTDSIGLTASVAQVVHVYLIEDATDEVCASASILNEGILQSATALTGGAEVTATTLYCTSAHTSRPIRYIGSVHATWSNPNWGSITDVSLIPATRSLMRQVFTSDGTWVAPKGVFNATICGRGGSGGGGGGSGTGGTGVGKGGMGGGGAATTCRATAVSPNTSYAITLGTAGTAGTGNGSAPGTDGGTAGDTTFGSLLTFKGAVGGLGASSVDASSFSSYQSAGYGIGGGGHGGHGGTSGAGSASGYRSTYASGGSASGGDTYDGGGGGGGDGVGGAAGNANGGNGSVGAAGGGGGGGAGSSIGSAGNGAAGTLGQLEVIWVM